MRLQINKLVVLFAFMLLPFGMFSQYVTIPDTVFRNYLATNYPGAMMGNQLDTTDAAVLNTTSLLLDSLFIRSLEGLQYFDNLQSLDCSYNLIKSFTALPPNLIYLDCRTNQLDTLPALPAGLQNFNCSNNHIDHMPILPAPLIWFDCSYNSLHTLPSLNAIVQVNCSHNLLDTLPALPAILSDFDCSANKIHSIPVLPTALQSLNTSSNPIYTLPFLPNSLTYINCDNDSLSVLPVLPVSLTSLICGANLLTSLPTLPAGLKTLSCSNNQLTALPSLPTTLLYLTCHINQLSALPALPSLLIQLNCASNFIPALPTLPASLLYLDYSDNPINTLPALPPNLEGLAWNKNITAVLPTLPSSLKYLQCNMSSIDSLPVLPNGLNSLECRDDSLTFLPVLPASLSSLDFSFNQLNTMPALPPMLSQLFFSNNLITNLPSLPTNISYLDCSDNIGLTCLPKLPPVMFRVRLDNTAINCLPNFFQIIDTFYTSWSVFGMSLCTPASGCQCAWNITGNVHSDTSANCYLDSLLPGPRLLKSVAVYLTKNNTFLATNMLSNGAQYSFDTGNNDTLNVFIDTFDMPFHVICPPSGMHQVILTPTDSMKTEINFGVECNGIDAGVQSIIGRFRPADITHIKIMAGNMAQFYNVNCPATYSATVTTIVEGPVQYIMPTGTAIVPSAVSGNMITYNIPDMSLIDGNTAFDIDVLTDSSAVMGSEVCITTTVSNVLADIKPSNNTLQICMPVVNSFDPNAKLVSPVDGSKPGDLLTYTIHFQNTGSDTAKEIIIRDTLSANLDLSSFKFLASSHEVDIDLQKNILVFYFHKINLLDSIHHEPQSHGWLQFRIKLKTDLPLSTRTTNTASIYFDYNPPILTDTAINYIGPDLTYAAPSNPIHLPTAITPNGDGLNDTWHILNPAYLAQKQLVVEQVFILNRWGQKIFNGSGDTFNWRAKEINSSDVFTYYIIYRTRSGTTRDQRGEITVVR